MNDRRHIAGLVQLTGVHFRSIQSEMAAILQQEARLRRNLAQLIASRQNRTTGLPKADDAAMIAGADVRWHQWVDQRRAVINGELALVLAAKESCRAKLQRAFGRDMATRNLQDRVEEAQLLIRKRRSDYES